MSELVLNVSQDEWEGPARFNVSVDGIQVLGDYAVSASHAAGESEAVRLPLLGPGPHAVTVSFTNDAWGGTPETDRNFYLDGATLDGIPVVGASGVLMSAGTIGFTVVCRPTYTVVSDGDAHIFTPRVDPSTPGFTLSTPNGGFVFTPIPENLVSYYPPTAATAATPFPQIILDTDLASDCDDVGDVAFACQAALNGDCNVLAMVAGNKHTNGATGLKVLVDYALPGHNILIGQYNGSTMSSSGSFNSSLYLDQIVTRFAAGVTGTFPGHVPTLRRALSVAPAKSVTYIMTGFGSVLQDLLASAADTNSPLTGQELFKAKVKAVYWAGGQFDTSAGSGSTIDFNFSADPTSCQYVCATLGTLAIPLYFAGAEVGGLLTTGSNRITAAPPAGTDPLVSPYEYAFELWSSPFATPRNAWGIVAVYSAIYGITPMFAVGGANGTVTVANDGKDQWASSPNVFHSYLARSTAVATVTAAFNAGIAKTSGAHTASGGTWGLGIGIPTTSGTVASTTRSSVLDAMSVSAMGAYSLTKLRSAFGGSPIRVQRSSDSTQLDIGFTSGGTLDTTALLSFAGVGNAFVVKWYDQSGNARDLACATATNFQVVVSGALNIGGTNSRPALKAIDTINNGLRFSSFPLAGTTVTANAVAAQSNTNSYKNLVAYQATGAAHHYDNAGSASFFVSNSGTYAIGTGRNGTLEFATAGSQDVPFVATTIYDGANVTVYRDGITATPTASTGTWGASGTGTLDIGSVADQAGTADNWAGNIFEVLIFATALSSADRGVLTGNQKTYYGTP